VITGPQLPATVTLPITPKIDARSLRDAFGATKQCIWFWRDRFDFPASEYRGPYSTTDTAAVAAWIVARGGKVIWS
jgi:hypothetical protein